MNQSSRMKTADFFREIEALYGWDLMEKEKEIIYLMARKHTASVILEHWKLFQQRHPGHSTYEFRERMELVLSAQEMEEGH